VAQILLVAQLPQLALKHAVGRRISCNSSDAGRPFRNRRPGASMCHLSILPREPKICLKLWEYLRRRPNGTCVEALAASRCQASLSCSTTPSSFEKTCGHRAQNRRARSVRAVLHAMADRALPGFAVLMVHAPAVECPPHLVLVSFRRVTQALPRCSGRRRRETSSGILFRPLTPLYLTEGGLWFPASPVRRVESIRVSVFTAFAEPRSDQFLPFGLFALRWVDALEPAAK